MTRAVWMDAWQVTGTPFGDDRTWNDDLRNDFNLLREAGHDHPDMKKIEALPEEGK